MLLRVRWHLGVVLLLATMACGQVEPFTNPDFTAPGPFDPTPPVRLTYNPGLDLQPAFLPGGEIVFGFARPGEINGDQCLGVLPNQGGTTIAESCPRTLGSRDSTERYGEARATDDNTVALVVASRLEGRRTDDNAWIGTAPWRSATEFTPRLRFPFSPSSGTVLFTPTHLSVVSASSVAYLGVASSPACPGFEYPCMDQVLLTYGRQAGMVDLATTDPPQVLSGTDYVTSIAPGRAPGSILFTRALEQIVYERDANGAETVLVEVPGFAVRDPSLAGNRLVSVVNGAVGVYTLADSTLVQVSGGGTLVLTDLLTGTSTILAEGAWERPSLSPDGRQVVAQQAGDIYRFDLP